MKKNLIRLLPIVLLAAGCTREIVDPLAENRGLTVDFLFSTHYTQGSLLTKAPDDLFDSPVTKTVFSGKDENGQDVTSSSQKERIDWKVGDKVDLMILKAGDPKDRRVYEIKAFTTEGNLKSKSTSVSSDNPFTFKGSGDYYIFATYPSHSIGKAFKTGNGYDYGLWNPSSTTGGFGLHMPENLACSIVDKGDSYVVMDDMDYAVMTAGKSAGFQAFFQCLPASPYQHGDHPELQVGNPYDNMHQRFPAHQGRRDEPPAFPDQCRRHDELEQLYARNGQVHPLLYV